MNAGDFLDVVNEWLEIWSVHEFAGRLSQRIGNLGLDETFSVIGAPLYCCFHIDATASPALGLRREEAIPSIFSRHLANSK